MLGGSWLRHQAYRPPDSLDNSTLVSSLADLSGATLATIPGPHQLFALQQNYIDNKCCSVTFIKRHGQLPVNSKLNDTWIVLQNLLMCMVSFYALYFIAVSLCIGIFRVEDVDSLLAPFDYTTQPSWHNPKYLVCVISTEVTYILGGLLFAWIVEEWVWDYAITVTLLHVGLTIAVMSEVPSTEHWWMALGAGLVMMILGGQILAYRLFRNNFVYPADLQNF